jgi:hypothetical protein
MSKLRIGTTYRTARPYPSRTSLDIPELKDGLPNYFYATHLYDHALLLLEKGINTIQSVKTQHGFRRPAILISTSPHKHGSEATPWQDQLDSDRGYVKYFGDNRSAKSPETAQGNSALLELFRQHNSGDRNIRINAAPILIFERKNVDGRAKGNVKFHGVALVTSASLVTQYQSAIGYFVNYVFEFTILKMNDENEELDFTWINKRRAIEVSNETCYELAPSAWKDWIDHGTLNVAKNRRRVSTLKIIKKAEQVPQPKSLEEKCLQEIYRFFTETKKHHFELLANKITGQIVSDSGAKYVEGWVTRASGDKGVDFVSRLDIGSGFATTKIVILGQAKCEKPTNPTSGKDLARTVARLKRGWIGAYVTTSYFSDSNQVEMIDDEYPLITIGGLQVAKAAMQLTESGGFKSTKEFLLEIERQYIDSVSDKRPEDILNF